LTETEQRSRLRSNLYGRRKGPKLSARQVELRRTLLTRLAFHPGDDPRTAFPNSVQDIWLEVGFGAGENLVAHAEQRSDIGLIGAEPYEAGVAKLLTKLDEKPLGNIRIYEGDGRDIIDALPDASIGRFFLLFPDPWPKTRHHKRRFLQMDMLDRLARVLKPRAELRFATDDKSYLPYALERLMAHPAFVWTAEGPPDWKNRPVDWHPTRYEAKAIKGPPAYLRFVRLSSPAPPR
jgi:tRNA (guanine-N7-)-methyltransferase